MNDSAAPKTSPVRRLREWPLTSLTAALGAAGLGAFMLLGSAAPEDSTVAAVDVPDAPSMKIIEVHGDDALAEATEEESERAEYRDESIARHLDTSAGHFLASPDAAPYAEPAEAEPARKYKKPDVAMKGAPDPHAPLGTSRTHRLAEAPPADIPHGLDGDMVGDAYGVGGLGLIGGGKGGGGEGSGYGRGTGAGFGGHPGAFEDRRDAPSEYDKNLHARQLTAGVTNDGADPEGYAKALREMSHVMNGVDVPASMWNLDAPQQRHDGAPTGLDVALVIDTTGSMGDELEYLKVELREIAREIEGQFPNVEQRWSMVAYRDHGDAYVTRIADFDDVDDFVTSLGQQGASGGGDMPEAMDAAMADALQLDWHKGGDTAKMVFLVGDAPPHRGAGEQKFAEAVSGMRDANVGIYPVAASGVDDRAELLMRMSAKVTGGQYIFLTDHSGIGSAHAKPHVDQYEVESLHQVMHRMIAEELSPSTQDVPAIATGPLAAPAGPIAHEGPCHHSNFWDRLMGRMGDHFEFALGFGLTMLAAIGLDVTLRRRRRGES